MCDLHICVVFRVNTSRRDARVRVATDALISTHGLAHRRGQTGPHAESRCHAIHTLRAQSPGKLFAQLSLFACTHFENESPGPTQVRARLI
jgi:hypothetical protein